MRNPLTTVTAGLCAATLSFAIVGCGGGAQKELTTSTSAATSAAAPQTTSPTMSPLPPPPARPDGTKKTLHDYIVEHNIAEVPYKSKSPGSPTVELAFPPGWSELAKTDTPDWAYGGIIYDTPKDPAVPPTMLAIANKLTGDVDPTEILQYAPGMLQDLPGFQPIGDSVLSKFSGFDAVTYKGTYTNGGKSMAVGEKTVVIPGKDKDFFVLQLQGTALAEERQVVIDAVDFINTNSKITAP
jgi:hypothetical protein